MGPSFTLIAPAGNHIQRSDWPADAGYLLVSLCSLDLEDVVRRGKEKMTEAGMEKEHEQQLVENERMM